jgi:serine/threonine protein kinase
LAPEIVSNHGHGKAVDWWSLGILLYELTVGIPPFYSQNVHEMYQLIKNAPLRFPPRLSREARQLITGLLKRDPTKRLGSGKSDWKS